MNTPTTVMLWEILVPTEINNKPIKLRYHKVWDSHVRRITGGLTILHPAKGQWVNKEGNLFVERMIPVRVAATREQIYVIAHMTAVYYRQQAVMFYRVSDEVYIKQFEHVPLRVVLAKVARVAKETQSADDERRGEEGGVDRPGVSPPTQVSAPLLAAELGSWSNERQRFRPGQPGDDAPPGAGGLGEQSAIGPTEDG